MGYEYTSSNSFSIPESVTITGISVKTTTTDTVWSEYNRYTSPVIYTIPFTPVPAIYPTPLPPPPLELEALIALEVDRRVKQELAKRKEQVEELPPLTRPRKINLEELPD